MNILSIFAAAALSMVHVETNYVKSDMVIQVTGTNEISAFLYGIKTTAHHTLTTNWVDDPVNSTFQLGIIYSNIIARVSYEGKTNELTMASKLIGLAGTRVIPAQITNIISKESLVWPIAWPPAESK